MPTHLRWFYIAILLALLSHTAQSHGKSELKVISMHLPTNFDYNNSKFTWDHYVHASLTEGLISSNVRGEITLGQAQSWSISADGLYYYFKLREDIFWSDGKPVVAKDFVQAWRRISDHKRQNYNRTFLRPLKNFDDVSSGTLPLSHLGVFAKDKKHLTITLSAPTAHFLKMIQVFQLAPVPSHYSDEQIDEMLSGDTTLKPVVNGPYNVGSKSENRILLTKNQYYWEADRVYYDQIIFSKPEDTDGKASIKAVITGEADIAIGHSRDDIQWAKKSHPSYYHKLSILGTEYYSFNSKNPVVQHADVREALSMAVNRKAISQRVLKSAATPAYNFTPNSLFAFHRPPEPDWTKIDFPERLERAAAILKKRGISPETPVTVEIKTQNYRNRDRVALAIKYAWEKLGVNTKITTATTPETYQQLESGNFVIARGGWASEYHDPYNFLSLLHSEDQRFTGMNKDARIDQLLRESLKVIDQSKRELIFKKIEQINHKRVLLMPLYNLSDYILKSPKIQGIGEAPFITSMRWARPKSSQPVEAAPQ